jgi:hypothetical protein
MKRQASCRAVRSTGARADIEAPAVHIAVTFSQLDLTKKWSWFTPAIYTPNIPLIIAGQWYIYTVRIDITDQYQNGYPSFFTTQNVKVHVSVSDTKQKAQSIAVDLETAAVAALIVAAADAIDVGFGDVAAAVMLGIAATCETGAQFAGLAAGDPPIPDPRFRIVAEPFPIKVPGEGEKNPLGAFVNAVTNVVAHLEAMGETDSRIAGARAANDRRSLKLQLDHFESVRRRLPDAGRDVGRKIKAAAGSLLAWQEKVTPTLRDRAVRELTHNLNFRAEVQKAFMAAGGGASSFQALLERSSMSEFVDGIANPVAVFSAMALAAEGLATAAAANKPSAPMAPLARTRAATPRTRKKRP